MRTWERKKNAKANKDEVKENRKGRKTERKEVCAVNSIVLMLTSIIHNKVFTWYRISLYVDKQVRLIYYLISLASCYTSYTLKICSLV